MADKILITGGTGFIGSNLVKKLYNGKDRIIIYAKDPTHPFLKGLDVEIIEANIKDYFSLLKAVKGCDYVYHLAACTLSTAKDRDEIFGTNVFGTENVMKACLKCGVKKAVYVSSGAVLGFSDEERPITEDDSTDFKDNLYAQSKKLGEDKVLEYVAKGLDAAIVLPGYVMGAGEIDQRRFGLFKSIARGRIKFTYPGGGGTVAVEDLVDGLILAMKKGKSGERYILSNAYVRLFDFYNLIAKILKKPKIMLRLPKATYYPMYMAAAILQKLMKSPPIATENIRWHYNFRVYDSSKAKKELGWEPKVPLEESIRRAVEYYRSIGVLKS